MASAGFCEQRHCDYLYQDPVHFVPVASDCTQTVSCSLPGRLGGHENAALTSLQAPLVSRASAQGFDPFSVAISECLRMDRFIEDRIPFCLEAG